jgi:hypothetical protein
VLADGLMYPEHNLPGLDLRTSEIEVYDAPSNACELVL